MQVFKTVFKILKKHLPEIMVYVGISVALMLMMQSSNSETFTETKLNIAVQNLDGGEASSAIVEYIGDNHTIKDMDFEDTDTLMDYLYYRHLDYAVTINEGFSEKLAAGETDGLFTAYKVDASNTATLFETQLQSIITSASCFVIAGDTPSDAISKAIETASTETTVNTLADSTPASAKAYTYFMVLGYSICAILIVTIVILLSVMMQNMIVVRTNASPYSSAKYIFEVFLASIVIAFVIWAMLIALVYMRTGDAMLSSATTPKAIINSLVFTVICTEISVLVAFVSSSLATAHIAANIISMGMSFLCGVFVQQSLLGDKVLSVARFLPAYWYVKGANVIYAMDGATYSYDEYIKCIGVQLIFVVLLFATILLVSGKRRRKKSN